MEIESDNGNFSLRKVAQQLQDINRVPGQVPIDGLLSSGHPVVTLCSLGPWHQLRRPSNWNL